MTSTTRKARNILLVGPSGSGKTTLVEALAYATRTIAKKGAVEAGTSLSDRTEEERLHQHSVWPSVLSIHHDGIKFNLIDTPGISEFLASWIHATIIADAALVTIAADARPSQELNRLWKLLSEAHVPRMIFVNKCDRDVADFELTIESLKDVLEGSLEVTELPAVTSNAVIDLLTERAYVTKDGAEQETGLPDSLAEQEHKAHLALVEDLVQLDDRLMERYLSDDEFSSEEIISVLRSAMYSCQIFPVACGSALKDLGICHLLQLLQQMIEPRKFDGKEPSAVVLAARQDTYQGRTATIACLGGTIRPDTVLATGQAASEGKPERIHQLLEPCPTEAKQLEELEAGDIAIVPRLSARVGDIIGAQPDSLVKPAAKLARPSLKSALVAPSAKEEERILTALQRFAMDDPGLEIEREQGTQRIVVCTMGPIHQAITLERLARTCGNEFSSTELATQYRETIAKPATTEGKYKKQTGGHGQYGVAVLTVEPLPRGDGFEFVDEIVGGAIPRNFIPAVEKGVREAMEAGGPYGFPVTDIRVRLIDGKHHPVDSSELSFKMAGSLALKAALELAGTIVLEPISKVELQVPLTSQGDVLGYLSQHRGKILGTAPTPDTVTIEADLPTSELSQLPIDLGSLTSGLGSFAAYHDRYEMMPKSLAEKLTAKA
jgi:elongation factor G